jgi:hypothetical protein
VRANRHASVQHFGERRKDGGFRDRIEALELARRAAKQTLPENDKVKIIGREYSQVVECTLFTIIQKNNQKYR